MSTSTCLSLPSLPDIDGIGTRVATYAQVLLSILTIALSPDGAFDSWWAILVTSLGLQIAAIIQFNNLSLFHALLVTWIAYPVFAMSWIFIFLHWRVEKMPGEVLLATHLHGFLFIGFGLYVWGTAASSVWFRNGCGPDNVAFVLFGASLRPTGWIHVFALIIYGFWALLFLLASAGGALVLIPPIRRRLALSLTHGRLHALTPSRTAAIVGVTLHNCFSLALSIAMVELMIARNPVSRSDGVWTLGQIAALILLASPLFTLYRIVRAWLWPGYGSGAAEARQNQGERAPLAVDMQHVAGREQGGTSKLFEDVPLNSNRYS